jgi:hypothetical protein
MNKPRTRPVGAMAIATVTVEISGLGSWGTSCSVEQVHRQASEEAVGFLRNLVAGNRGEHRLRIIGQPEVKTITTERK